MRNDLLIAIGCIGLILSACSYDRSPGSGNYEPNNPGYRYTPAYAMYVSIPYEPLSQVKGKNNQFNNHGKNLRKPPENSIARGNLSNQYPFPDNAEGYEMAGDSLESPFKPSEKVLSEGKVLYSRYCQQCHGEKGKSKGPVMANSSYPPPPFGEFSSTYIDTISVGKMYHTITYGKGAMGSHASQVSPKERWKLIHYIKEVLNNIE